ncbi:MAG: hypothetical protein ACE15B_12330 [Bryobacteraceae bacterium]
MRPRLEIHVPISPTPNFLNRIHYLAASLKDAGGLARESSIVVTVGADQEPVDLSALLPWSRRYPIRWRWVDRDTFRRFTFYGTALDRFRVDFSAPMVLMADADVIVTRDFGDLVESVQKTGAYSGVIAHISPWSEDHLSQRTAEEWWQAIFDRAGVGAVPFTCEHTSWNVLTPPEAPRFCPPYFNFGVMLAPSECFASIGESIFRDMETVNSVLLTPYRCQIALSVSLVRSGWPYRIMPLRYNFPNFPAIAEVNLEELRDIRIIHYINQDYFKKDQTLDSVENVSAWLDSHNRLPSIQQLLRDRIGKVHRRVLYDRASRFERLRMVWN